MRLLLPVVALVASGLQADALAPVEGDPPNLPVFPTGDAEGPSFYSHSPHPVSPHSRIHHRRSISALVLIVPIVAVVFLIYQCILHLKRRDDLFITVQSRRLAAGEQDPCNPHEGDEGGSDPSSSPAGGPSHARQLGALQLTPADTACLTSEEVMAIGDADRILRSSIRNIQGLESQVGTLTATAANLRSMLDASPGEGGPEAERRSELEKMLHGNSQQTEALRRELKDKKLHCNGMAWTEGQQSRSLLLRARFFRSGRLLTGRAAAALVARDVVLGVPSSDIFDEALKLALSTLVHRLLAEGSNCQGLLSGDTFPSDEDIQRAKAAHSDLRNVASQLQVVDAMYGTTGHLQPVRESAKSLGAALERFAEGPAQKPQARVSVTPYGQPIPSGDLGPPGHPLWTPYGSQWSLTDRSGLGGRHPSVSSLPGSAPLSSSASLRGPAMGGFHRRGPSDPRYGSLPRMGRHSSLGAPGPDPWHLFGSGFSGGMPAPSQRQPGASSTRGDSPRRRASVAHVPSSSPHPRASTSSAGEGFHPGADPRGPHHRPGSAPRSSASSRRSDGVPASQPPAEPRFGAAPRRGHSQRTAAPPSTGDPRRGPSPAPHPPSSQRPGTPLARPPATRPTPSGTPGMPHGQQPHGQQPYPPYVHPPVTSQPVHFPGAPATSGRRIDVPPPRAPQPPPPPAQPAPSPSPSPYPSPSPAQWPGAPHAPPSRGPIPSSTPGVPAPGQRPQAPPPQPPTTAPTPSHPPGAPPHLGRRIDVPPDPVAPPTHSTTAPAPVPPSTRGVPPMQPPQPTPYPTGAPSQRPSTSSAGRPHAPGPAPPSAPAAPPTQPTQPTPYPTTAPSQRPSTSAVGRLDVPPPSSTSAPAAPPTQPPQPMPYPTTAPSQRPSTSSTGWPHAPGPAPPSAPAAPPTQPTQPTPYPTTAPSQRPSTSAVGRLDVPPPPSTSAPAAPPTQPPQPMPYTTAAPSQRPSTSSTGQPHVHGPAPPPATTAPPTQPPQPTPHPPVAPSPRPSTSSVGPPVAPPPPPPPKGPPPPTLPKPKWKPPPPSSSPDPSTPSVHGPGDSPAQAPQPDPTAGPPPSTPSTEDAGTPRAPTPTAYPGYGSLPRTSSSGRSGHSGLGPKSSSTGSIGFPISERVDVPPDVPPEEGPKFGTPPRKLPTLLLQHWRATDAESAPSDVETQPPEQPVPSATDAPAPPPGPPQQPQPETPGEPSAPSPSQVALQSTQPSETPAPPPSTTPEEPDDDKSKKKSKKGKKAKSSDGGEPEGGTHPTGKKKSPWGWGSKRKSKDSKVTSSETASPPPPPPSQDPVEPSTSSTTSTSPPGPQEPALRPPSAPGIPAVPSEAPQAPSPPPSSSTSTAPPPGPPTESIPEPRAASPAPSAPGPATLAPPVLPPRPHQEMPPYQGPAPIQQPGSPPEHPPSLPGATVPPTPTPAPPSDGPQPATPLDYQGGARPKYGRPPTVPVPQLDRPAPTDSLHRRRGPITPGLVEEWLSTSPAPPTPPPPATPPQTHEGEPPRQGPMPDQQHIPVTKLFLGHPAGVTSPLPTPAPPSDAPQPPPSVAYAWGTPAPAPHVAPPHEPLTEHGPVTTPSGLQLGAPGVSIGPEYPPVPLTAPEDEPVGPSGEFPPSPPDGLGPEEWPEPPQLPPWPSDADNFPMDMPPPPPPPEEGQQQPGDAPPPPEEPSPPPAPQPTPPGGDPPPPERPPSPKREPSDRSGLATDDDLEAMAQKLEGFTLGAEVVTDTVMYDPKLLSRAEELFGEGSSLLTQAEQLASHPDADPRRVKNLKSRIDGCRNTLTSLKRCPHTWERKLSELTGILKSKTDALQTSRAIPPGMLPDWQAIISMDALRSSMGEATKAHTALGALGEHFADSPTRQSTLQAVARALEAAEQEISLTGGICASVCAKALWDSMPDTPENSLPPAEDSTLVTAQSFSTRLRALGISGREFQDLENAIKERQRLAGIY